MVKSTRSNKKHAIALLKIIINAVIVNSFVKIDNYDMIMIDMIGNSYDSVFIRYTMYNTSDLPVLSCFPIELFLDASYLFKSPFPSLTH